MNIEVIHTKSNICVNVDEYKKHATLIVAPLGDKRKYIFDVVPFYLARLYCTDCKMSVNRDHPQFTPVLEDYYNYRETVDHEQN